MGVAVLIVAAWCVIGLILTVAASLFFRGARLLDPARAIDDDIAALAQPMELHPR